MAAGSSPLRSWDLAVESSRRARRSPSRLSSRATRQIRRAASSSWRPALASPCTASSSSRMGRIGMARQCGLDHAVGVLRPLELEHHPGAHPVRVVADHRMPQRHLGEQPLGAQAIARASRRRRPPPGPVRHAPGASAPPASRCCPRAAPGEPPARRSPAMRRAAGTALERRRAPPSVRPGVRDRGSGHPVRPRLAGRCAALLSRLLRASGDQMIGSREA